jgi:uncharacterized membrane protein YhaH (DUF805 family)
MKGKMIVPMVITLLMIAFEIFYFVLLVSVLKGVMKYALGIVPVALTVMMICVCVERMREIRKGEEDDIGQY